VTPAGTRIHPKEIDLTFLQAGATQRDEVAHQLAAIDTSYDNPRLFWGRWSESRWDTGGFWDGRATTVSPGTPAACGG